VPDERKKARRDSRSSLERRLALAEARAVLADSVRRDLEAQVAAARIAFRDVSGKPTTNERARRLAKALGEIDPSGKVRDRLPHAEAARSFVHLLSGRKLLGRALEIVAQHGSNQGARGTAAALAGSDLSGLCMVEVVDAPPRAEDALALVAAWHGYASKESCRRALQTVRARWRRDAEAGRFGGPLSLIAALDRLPAKPNMSKPGAARKTRS